MMRMARRSALKIWIPGTATIDAEGNQRPAWTSTPGTGDFQPIGNRVRAMSDFGKDTIQPDSRILFADEAAFGSVSYNHCIQDLTTSKYYEVAGIAPWYRHWEFLLQPWHGPVPT